MTANDAELPIRLAAFRFLERETARHGDVLSWALLQTGLKVDGEVVPLLGASGIWKPRALGLPISITTTPPKPGRPAPYADEVGEDGLLRYRYQGDDPNNHFNLGLREVFRRRLPLVYFYGVDKGLYRPFWPAFIEHDDPTAKQVRVALNDAATSGIDLTDADSTALEPLDKAYTRRITLQRLHQAGFRDRVLRAYQRACAVCRLRHLELLDAAHIVPDSDPRGEPKVPNGLALCKIHHAAFDAHIMGIRPDGIIQVRSDVLAEADGPMLRFGLQEAHGQTLHLPRRRSDRPDGELLEIRFEQFRLAG